VPVRGRRAGATVRLYPLLTGEFLAPPGFLKRPGGPLGFVGGLGVHVPRRQWGWCPISAFLVEHSSAGALLIDTGTDASALREPAQQFGSLLPRLSKLRVRAGQDAVSQARQRGVEPAAIGTVVLTHLHSTMPAAPASCPTRGSCSTAVSGRPPCAAGCSRATGARRSTDHLTGARWISAAPPRALALAMRSICSATARCRSSRRARSLAGARVGRAAHRLGLVPVVGDAAYTRRAISEGYDQLARADLAAYRASLDAIRRWAEENPAAPIICSHDYEFWANPPALYA
jgi:N-acyl homoserine lactone hydrolase